MSESINLDHVGPIEHLTIPLPDGGGVVVLRGINGCGKSHALNGVTALYNASARKGLRNSDGVPSGHVEGLGVTVRLGRSNTVKGELVCESLDGRVDPSQLVDPGIKDPLAADARRLATLIRLAGVEVSAQQWAESIGQAADIIELETLVGDDPVATADKIRRRLHDCARDMEKGAESRSNESAALAKSIADIDLSGPCDELLLGQQLDDAATNLAKAEQQRAESSASAGRLAEALQRLEALQSIDIGPIEESIAEWAAAIDDLDDKIETCKEQINAFQNLKTSAEGKLARAQTDLQQAVARIAERQQYVAIVDTVLPECPPGEQIEQLKWAKDVAREALQNGQVIRRAKATAAQLDHLASKAVEIATEAKTLRGLARSTDGVLEQALIDAGFVTVKVHDGRLCVESDRGLEPFSDLSHGERWRMALDLAAAGLPKGSVLPVCQEAFESLDPDNRAHINQLAKDRGLVIVTAEACGGDLRAELYESEVTA